MRVVGWLVVLTAVGCSARSIRSKRSPISSWDTLGSYGWLSYPSSPPEGSCASGYSHSSNQYSSNDASKDTITNAEGLHNFNHFAAGAAVGSVNGRKSPTYYYSYSGYRYSGSCNFGESVCKANVSKWDIESLKGTSLTPASINGLVAIYWTCNENEYCCGQTCCPDFSFPTAGWIIISILVIPLVLACCCVLCCRCNKGLVSAQQPVIVKYNNQNEFIRQLQVPRPRTMSASNPSAEPPPAPSTIRQQAPHAPYSWLHQAPRSDQSQPEPPPTSSPVRQQAPHARYSWLQRVPRSDHSQPEPRPTPSTIHQQALHTPYSLFELAPRNDPCQPTPIDSPPQYRDCIWTTSTSLSTPPDYAELYPTLSNQ